MACLQQHLHVDGVATTELFLYYIAVYVFIYMYSLDLHWDRYNLLFLLCLQIVSPSRYVKPK